MQTPINIYHGPPKRLKEWEYSFMKHPLLVMCRLLNKQTNGQRLKYSQEFYSIQLGATKQKSNFTYESCFTTKKTSTYLPEQELFIEIFLVATAQKKFFMSSVENSLFPNIFALIHFEFT